jgi:hypothetical protein
MTVYTDQNKHDDVTHGREYVRGNVHTNGIETFWALLKRALPGRGRRGAHVPRYGWDARASPDMEASDGVLVAVVNLVCFVFWHLE